MQIMQNEGPVNGRGGRFEFRTTVIVEIYRVCCPDCGVKTEKVPQLPCVHAASCARRVEEGRLTGGYWQPVVSLPRSSIFDLALNLAEQYMRLVSHWQWGDSILEWIRQCEITFENRDALRNLLHPDVWPHASRSSFVSLLMEKSVPTHGVRVENAVGLRLTFRQPPPIDCFSNQFLFYLNTTVTQTAYHTWARLARESP